MSREVTEYRHVRVAPLSDDAVEAVCSLAGLLDLDCLKADLVGCADKGEFLDRVARAFGFPEWFGQNWDALFDCLGDFSWRPASGRVLILENAGGLQSAAPEVFDTALSIFSDAAVAWAGRGVPVRVLVDAPRGA